MVELQWQLAAEDQSDCSLMEGTLFEAVQEVFEQQCHLRRTYFAFIRRFPPKMSANMPDLICCSFPGSPQSLDLQYLWIWSSLLGSTDEPLLRATHLWILVLANDVYGFHSRQPECLRSLQVGLSRVWPRTPGAPAALLRTFSHLSRSRSPHSCAFPAWKPFSWQCVLRARFGLRLPRRSEHSPSVCLHVVPAQQSQH